MELAEKVKKKKGSLVRMWVNAMWLAGHAECGRCSLSGLQSVSRNASVPPRGATQHGPASLCTLIRSSSMSSRTLFLSSPPAPSVRALHCTDLCHWDNTIYKTLLLCVCLLHAKVRLNVMQMVPNVGWRW